jgi:hypothetical protein
MGRDHFGDLGIDWKMVLTPYGQSLWGYELDWIVSEYILLVSFCQFELYKRRRVFRLGQRLLAPEGLYTYFMELRHYGGRKHQATAVKVIWPERSFNLEYTKRSRKDSEKQYT